MATKKKLLQAAAGTAAASGGAGGLNVEQVFSTYLYEGNGSANVIDNGINLGQSYGSGSVLLDGYNNADYLSVASSAEFGFGTGDFTIECWVFRKTDTGATNNLVDFRQSSTSEVKPSLAIDSGDKLAFYVNGAWRTVGTTSVPVGQWVHAAVVRSSGTSKVYYNGAHEGTAYSDTNNYGTTVLNIGATYNGSFDLDGYIAEVRVSDTARYTSNFTPPTSSFSSDSNTVFLSCQGSSPFTDKSSNAFTVVQNGIPKASTFGPFDAADAGEGGLVWQKRRDLAENHRIFDTETGEGKYLITNSTGAQGTDAGNGTFNANGFSISGNNWNTSGADYASWTFRKAPKFFDVVGPYTGNGTAGRTISHNLGTTVGTIIIKRTDTTGYDWIVYHRSKDGEWGKLNETGAFTTSFAPYYFGNDSATITPTSTEFTLGTAGAVNASGGTYVAYLFAHNDGDGTFGPTGDQDIIKCGSYTGTGSSNFIDLGFEPQWVLVKKTSGTAAWELSDNMRGLVGGYLTMLEPNSSSAEVNAATSSAFSPNPTGMTIDGGGSSTNQSGASYIYIAIRRGPMAVPTDATDVFAIEDAHATSGSGPSFVSNFVTDMVLEKQPTASADWYAITRLMGNKYVRPNSTGVEATGSATTWDYMNGAGEPFSSSPTFQGWMWKRAPSFCDVVAYTGNGTAGRTVSHNLGVAPEMMWVKARNASQAWAVYHSGMGNTKYMRLNDTTAQITSSTRWNDTSPTDSVFTVGTDSNVNNASNTYIAYLFASLDGVSKLGSVSHTSGTPTNVDCGFSAGARFIILKRYDAVSDWWVFDTERGIAAGNDARLILNSTAAETSTDQIDPYSAGFTIDSSRATGDYIFYAVS